MNSIKLICAFIVGIIIGVALGLLTYLYVSYGLIVTLTIVSATIFMIFLGYVFDKYIIEGLFI